MSTNTPQLPESARAALARGSKIEAIKAVREANAMGLKEAKEFVEEFLERNPDVAGNMKAANAESAKGALGWVVLFAAVGTLLYYILMR